MIGNIYADAAVCAVAVFLLTLLLIRLILPVLRRKKIGQNIFMDGPKWHEGKQGTPTMGGITFILAILIVMSVFYIYLAITGGAEKYIPLALTLSLGVLNGMIGFFDDYAKLIKKENQGFTIIQKLILQLVVASAYVCVMSYTGYLSTSFDIPFCGATLDLGFFAYPVYVLIIAVFVNSTNLTDGLDGLCSGITFVVSAFLLFVAIMISDAQLSLVSAAMIGAILGFLIYNYHPAKIFMGDTGSLFIGGIIIGAGFMTGQILLMLIAGFVYIFEFISSFLQVIYFKLTHGKRLFKMAPVHHHFEKCGWSEVKILYVFSGVTLLLCVVSWFGWIL